MHTNAVNDVIGVDELEATGSALVQAHERGHVLGDWRLIGEQMRLAGCRLCGRLAWIVRPPGEETWRVGGNALNADCERRFQGEAQWIYYSGTPAGFGFLGIVVR
jgi:hypothetical protein